MKAKYLIMFLILILVFNLGLGCGGSESKEKIIEEESLTTEAKTINVKYVVLGFPKAIEGIERWSDDPEVSVTYSNAQGGTEQINGLTLKEDLNSVFADLTKYWDFEGTEENWRGKIIAHYDSFPKDEFLYISAQNQKSYGAITVIIIVDNYIWKF